MSPRVSQIDRSIGAGESERFESEGEGERHGRTCASSWPQHEPHMSLCLSPTREEGEGEGEGERARARARARAGARAREGGFVKRRGREGGREGAGARERERK
eukprot:151236-Pleurochrysis_carterae.AAC.1